MFNNVNKRNIKVLSGILTLLAIILIFALSNNTSLFIDNKSSQTELKISDLIIPTQEDILRNGYPINESGYTYGPNMGNLLLVDPDLLLAEGEDGVIGYIFQGEGISSPSELDSYKPPESTPLYLHDGKTIIGTFKYNRSINE